MCYFGLCFSSSRGATTSSNLKLSILHLTQMPFSSGSGSVEVGHGGAIACYIPIAWVADATRSGATQTLGMARVSLIFSREQLCFSAIH